jgi:hypothetical protein
VPASSTSDDAGDPVGLDPAILCYVKGTLSFVPVSSGFSQAHPTLCEGYLVLWSSDWHWSSRLPHGIF